MEQNAQCQEVKEECEKEDTTFTLKDSEEIIQF